MTRDHIRQFLDRDWTRLATAKAGTWMASKGTPARDLHVANELRRHALSIRPDWPGAEDRADDLRSHLRVSEALGAVSLRAR